MTGCNATADHSDHCHCCRRMEKRMQEYISNKDGIFAIPAVYSSQSASETY